MDVLLVVLKELELLLIKGIWLQSHFEFVGWVWRSLDVDTFTLVDSCDNVECVPLFGLLPAAELAALR